MDTNNESVNSIHNRNKRFNPQNIFQSFFNQVILFNKKLKQKKITNVLYL